MIDKLTDYSIRSICIIDKVMRILPILMEGAKMKMYLESQNQKFHASVFCGFSIYRILRRDRFTMRTGSLFSLFQETWPLGTVNFYTGTCPRCKTGELYVV